MSLLDTASAMVDDGFVSQNIIYALVDPRTDEIRYIGKSTTVLARPKSGKYYGYCKTWILGCKQAGVRYGIITLRRCTNKTELDAQERQWIALGKNAGWRLTNLCDGGGGLLNPSDDVRQKMRNAKLGKKRSPEVRARIAVAQTGSKRSNETRRRQSESKKLYYALHPEAAKRIGDLTRGKTLSAEQKARISQKLTGLKQSAETIEKRAVKARGRKQSTEHVEKRASQLRGRKASETVRQNMSSARMGKLASAETKARMCISQRVRGPRSEETRERMRLAQQKRFAKCP